MECVRERKQRESRYMSSISTPITDEWREVLTVGRGPPTECGLMVPFIHYREIPALQNQRVEER